MLVAESSLPVAGFEELDAQALHTEDVMLKIRLRQGLPLRLLRPEERERAAVAIADGLVTNERERLVLTDRGRLLADAVVRTVLG
ncbi:hemN C-terminal domain protein [Mycobacterium xenopi 3993]|nr:hemN C-terminal domain protein [Mycobacterium xenopi 3993]